MKTCQLTMLGTAATRPSAYRRPAATLVSVDGKHLLIDAGEGIQQGLLQAKIGPGAIDRIIITHFHSDHYLGLAGLVQSAALDGADPIKIIVPTKSLHKFRAYLDACDVNDRVYDLVGAVKNKEIAWQKGWDLMFFDADHTVPALSVLIKEQSRAPRLDAARAKADGAANGPMMGALARGEGVTLESGLILHGQDYLFPAEEGRSIIISGDTRENKTLELLAKDASCLVHETTYPYANKDMAKLKGHSSAKGVGSLAKRAGVKKLVLTHLGARVAYKELLAEAKLAAGDNIQVIMPRDGDIIEIIGR